MRHACRKRHRHALRRSSGNTAFDAYKQETIARLEEEQSAFRDFLKRLRETKDQAEFDAFLAEQARAPKSDTDPQASPA